MVAFADLIARVDDISITGNPDVKINKVEVDSRLIEPGDLFIAVEGETVDGTKFIPDAVKRGAVAIVAARQVDESVACTGRVKEIRSLVAKVAAAYYKYPSRELILIGVTGTNGKTTITYLVKSIMAQRYGDAGLIGTLGYYTGRRTLPAINTTPGPLELERMLRAMRDEGLRCAVMEVSSHGLAMMRVEELEFNAIAISNVTQDHLDYHHDFESYRAAKAHLLELVSGDDRWAVLNLDDPSYEYLRGKTKSPCLTFSMNSDRADFAAEDIDLDSNGAIFRLRTPTGTEQVKLKLLGRFNVENALCAAALSFAAGADMKDIIAGLNSQGCVRGRADKIDLGQDFTVLVDFAHTPDALEKIGRTAREICNGRLLILFGCGGDRDRTKRAPMGKAASTQADFMIVTSDNPRSEDPLKIIEDIKPGLNGSKEILIEPDRKKAIESALSRCRPGDVLVVAGKGHEDYQIIGGQKTHFDDRQMITEWLKRERA